MMIDVLRPFRVQAEGRHRANRIAAAGISCYRPKFGPSKKVADADHIPLARRMKADGHTGKAIAKYLGVGRADLRCEHDRRRQ
jgi:hypothetical protein